MRRLTIFEALELASIMIAFLGLFVWALIILPACA